MRFAGKMMAFSFAAAVVGAAQAGAAEKCQSVADEDGADLAPLNVKVIKVGDELADSLVGPDLGDQANVAVTDVPEDPQMLLSAMTTTMTLDSDCPVNFGWSSKMGGVREGLTGEITDLREDGAGARMDVKMTTRRVQGKGVSMDAFEPGVVTVSHSIELPDTTHAAVVRMNGGASEEEDTAVLTVIRGGDTEVDSIF